jgi:ABC-type lipoprotein release transport system permease subunit
VTTCTLLLRSVRYHARAQIALLLGVAVGTAALTGALLVGESMRGSLRETALNRLGPFDSVLIGPRFVREALADEMFHARACSVSPAVFLRGAATQPDSGATVARVNVWGMDETRWTRGETKPASGGDGLVLNAALADDLGATVGTDVLIRIGRPAAVSTETVLGRRDQVTRTLRLTVSQVIPNEGIGALEFSPQQAVARNAYIPLATLQRRLEQEGRVNALLATWGRARPDLEAALQLCLTPADLGLRLREDDEHGYIAVESERFLLEPPAEEAARAAAAAMGLQTVGVLAALANTIEVVGRSDAVVPYSVVAAVESVQQMPGALVLTDGTSPESLAPGEILLNEWTAEDLGAAVGDSIRLSYYVLDVGGQLRTDAAEFRLRGIVCLAGPAADRGFTPTYASVTDADSVADWDPPFPIDLRRIRDKDEAYWDTYGATPKAFVSLTDGQRLWAREGERLGRLTSLRVLPPAGETLAQTRAAYEQHLRECCAPAAFGLVWDDVRDRVLAASEGTTDFGGLFVGLSQFLIVAAALLVALLFRLGIERRSGEVGLLLAVGFSPWRVFVLLLGEGLAVAIVGGAIGLLGARAYAWLMLAGLRTWWSAAAQAPFLRLHESVETYAIGYIVGLAVAALATAWALRGLTRISVRGLLAGAVQSGRPIAGRRGRTVAGVVAVLALGTAVGAGVLPQLTDAVSQSVAFFVGGTALLVGLISGLAGWLRGEPRGTIHGGGWRALVALGLRNARRRVGRSVLTVGLIAAATFLITSMQAMRLPAPTETSARDSGSGGFTLLAEAMVPLPHDLATAAGQEELGVSPATRQALAGAELVPFRLRAGDEASCLNLYRPLRPRVLGATPAMAQRGGFAFSQTLASTAEERANPWLLLKREFSDGAIPVIADEAAVLWQLHLGLGQDVSLIDERGVEVRGRIVGMLKGSVLQGELVVSEAAFTRLYPSVAGFGFYLVDVPGERAAEVGRSLAHDLEPFGLAITQTSRRLAELQAVQNTYLSAFQTLGGLGLLLGTVGLVAVLLRNVWERRSELALMQACGFSRAALGGVVLSENGFLAVCGLLIGLVSAVVLVWPQAAARAGLVPWGSLAGTFAAVLAAGLGAGLVALVPVLRGPLVPALRAE